jgi:hypothetical protein
MESFIASEPYPLPAAWRVAETNDAIIGRANGCLWRTVGGTATGRNRQSA